MRADMKFRRKVAINKLPGSLKNAVEKQIFGRKNQDKKLRKPLKSSGPSKLTWFINFHNIKLVQSLYLLKNCGLHFIANLKLVKFIY